MKPEQGYYDAWYIIFREILGWTKKQVNKWAERWDLKKDDIFYHEDPIYWAEHTLIPEDIAKMIDGYHLDRLGWKIGDIINANTLVETNGLTSRDMNLTNWDNVRKELTKLFNQTRNRMR